MCLSREFCVNSFHGFYENDFDGRTEVQETVDGHPSHDNTFTVEYHKQS